MTSIIDEIKKLRGNKTLSIDPHNKNRYRIVVNEENGYKSAYYFSVPIYSLKGSGLVDPSFSTTNDGVLFEGSSAKITIGERIILSRDGRKVSIGLRNPITYVEKNRIICGSDYITPTINGIAYRVFTDKYGKASVEIETDDPFHEIRANDRFFAIMERWLEPLVVASCVGISTSENEINAPAKMEFRKISSKKYILEIDACVQREKWVLIEINMYEPKLLNDTAVESKNVNSNNAYGTAAFVGFSECFGEQWLYTRVNDQLMPEIYGSCISKAVLHVPLLSRIHGNIIACESSSRFCSFGITWIKKVPPSNRVIKCGSKNGYLEFDITDIMTEGNSGMLRRSNGIVIMEDTPGIFTTFSTGDSVCFPQILEIKYR